MLAPASHAGPQRWKRAGEAGEAGHEAAGERASKQQKNCGGSHRYFQISVVIPGSRFRARLGMTVSEFARDVYIKGRFVSIAIDLVTAQRGTSWDQPFSSATARGRPGGHGKRCTR